jgi:hypothetical protein
MKTSKTIKLALAAFAAVALISTAEAASFTVTVDGLTPFSAAVPPASASGTLGDFEFSLTAMINTVPPPNNPALDLAGGVTFTGTGPATITLCIVGDGFVPVTPLIGAVGGSFAFDTSAGGTIFQTILVNGVLPGNSTNTVILDPNADSNGFHSSNVTISPTSAPFSLEDCVTITFNGPGFVSFDAGVFRGVPDSGATAVLLGIGLLTVAGVAKLRRAKVGV